MRGGTGAPQTVVHLPPPRWGALLRRRNGDAGPHGVNAVGDDDVGEYAAAAVTTMTLIVWTTIPTTASMRTTGGMTAGWSARLIAKTGDMTTVNLLPNHCPNRYYYVAIGAVYIWSFHVCTSSEIKGKNRKAHCKNSLGGEQGIIIDQYVY